MVKHFIEIYVPIYFRMTRVQSLLKSQVQTITQSQGNLQGQGNLQSNDGFTAYRNSQKDELIVVGVSVSI
jgi:hypothetical protein